MSETLGQGSVLVDRRGGQMTVTLNRPEKKNAANEEMWRTLVELFSGLRHDREVRAVVVTGAGGDFCSGADLSDPRTLVETIPLARMRLVGDATLAVARLPQPTIAKVRGVAAGAGLSLALACDLVVAAKDARLSEIFAKRGLALDGGSSWLLPRRVGMTKAKELAFFAEMISGEEAEAIGLVNRAVDPNQLDSFVDDWASRLAQGAPIALSLTKALLASSPTTSLEEALEAEAHAQSVALASQDASEAMKAWMEKREARFEGR